MKKIICALFIILTIVISIPKNTFAETCPAPGPDIVPPNCACNSTTDCKGGGSYVCEGTPRICQPQSTSGSYYSSAKEHSATENFVRGKENNPGIVSHIDNAIGDLAASKNGGVMTVMNYTAMIYKNRPASTQEYLADLKRNIGFPVKDAYAQAGGFGFNSVSPVLNLWKFMRNLALAGFVIVFVVIGIMIILRSKIDPRTVITIQQAIPRIVIALVLVVFSYAIVGLMIDTTTLLTRLGASLLQSGGYIAQGGTSDTQTNQYLNDVLNANVFALFQQLYNADQLVGGLLNIDDQFNRVSKVLSIDAFAGGGLTRTVLWIAMFIAVIRTFFVLLQSYLSVTLTIIFSPFQFLMYAIPGQGGGIGGWFRKLLSHLLVFPTVFFMLAMAAIFYNQAGNVVSQDNTSADNIWKTGNQNVVFTPDQSYWNPPALGNWSGVVGPLLTLGIILTVPRAAAMVRETVNPGYKGSASDGAAAEHLQRAAGRIPLLGSFTKA